MQRCLNPYLVVKKNVNRSGGCVDQFVSLDMNGNLLKKKSECKILWLAGEIRNGIIDLVINFTKHHRKFFK